MKKERLARCLALAMAALTALGVVSLWCRPASASVPVAISVEKGGGSVLLTGLVVRDRTLAPVRALGEALGASVSWDGKSRAVRLEKGSIRIRMVVGQAVAEINGQSLNLETPPAIVDERSYAPVRFIGESLGYVVEWDENQRRVIIKPPKPEDLPENMSGGDEQTLFPKTRVILQKLAWQEERLKVDLSGTPVKHAAFSLSGPARVVLDLWGVVVPTGVPKEVEIGWSNVKRARLGQFQIDPLVARVVVDLAEPMGYSVEAEGNALYIVFLRDLKKVTCKAANEGTVVSMELSAPGNGEVKLQEKDGVSGILVSIPNCLSRVKPQIEVAAGPVKRITAREVVHSPPAVEVWIEVAHSVSYQVLSSGADSNIRVRIAPSPLAGRVIVLDPGHGGSDPGCTGASGGYEKDINLAIAQKLKELLRRSGARVVMTREGDETVDIWRRVELIDAARPHAAVSIHCNSFKQPSMRGLEVYHCSLRPFTQRLASVVYEQLVSDTGLEGRGVRKAEFVMLKETKSPTILVEAGYLTNPEEERLLKTASFQEKVARSILAALVKFFS